MLNLPKMNMFFSLSAVQYEGKSLACVVLAAVVVLYYTSATQKGTFYSGLTVDWMTPVI